MWGTNTPQSFSGRPALSIRVERRLRSCLQHLCETCRRGEFAATHEAGIVNRFQSGVVTRWPSYRILSHSKKEKQAFTSSQRWVALSARVRETYWQENEFYQIFWFFGRLFW